MSTPLLKISAIAALFVTVGTATGQTIRNSNAAIEVMTQAIGDFRGSWTLRDWRTAHSGDFVESFDPRREMVNNNGGDQWCAQANNTTTASDGKTILRQAYFYVPVPSETVPLPSLREGAIEIGDCVLGEIWVEVPQPDLAAGKLGAERLRDALAAKIGPPQANAKVSFFGAAAWGAISSWRNGEAIIVSAYDNGRLSSPEKRRVLAFAALPIADSQGFLFGRAVVPEKVEYDRNRTKIRSVAAATGLTAEESAVEKFLDDNNEWQHRSAPCPSASQMPLVLQRWLAATAGMEAPKKAAGLLIADLAFQSTATCFHQNEKTLSPKLKAIGAELEYSQLGGAYEYTRTWLRKAYSLQQQGEVGGAAFLEWMRTGFAEHCCCQSEEPEFRRVIKRGEEFLKSKHAAGVSSAAEFMVADAYADIVALAAGELADYADASEFRNEAPQARRRAIEHYQAGLALDKASPEARNAWRSAWRLLAGLPPAQTRFFCVYD